MLNLKVLAKDVVPRMAALEATFDPGMGTELSYSLNDCHQLFHFGQATHFLTTHLFLL